MLHWVRTAGMAPNRPSEEEINKEIKHFDPKKLFKSLYPKWRHEMLVGRDMFFGRIPRHDPTPPFPQGVRADILGDYPNLTPLIRTILGHYQPQGPLEDCNSGHILALEPCAPRDFSKPAIHLLGTEMMRGEALPWDPNFTLRGKLSHSPGQVEWIRYVLTRHGDALRKARIYEAVLLSLYEYNFDPVVFRAFAENWNYSSNTIPIQDRKMMINLRELQELSGLPTRGALFEEYCPKDTELYGLLPDGTDQHSESLREVFKIYNQLLENQLKGLSKTQKKRLKNKPGVTFKNWVTYFTDKSKLVSDSFARPSDPFGTGKREVKSNSWVPDVSSYASTPMGQEILLIAFLSWWLCYFVVPSKPEGMIRPGTFVMASLLAKGEKVSLTVPALINICRSMRILTSSQDPSHCTEVIPFHFIFGWLNAHWAGLYAPVIDRNLYKKLPLMCDIAGAPFTRNMSKMAARCLFFNSQRTLRCGHSRVFSRNLPSESNWRLFDGVPPPEERAHKLEGFRDVEYLISIRCGWLPWRQGDHIIFEPYLPQMCAHQFGYDQEIPEKSLPTENLSLTLEDLSLVWASLQRVNTGSSFIMPRADRIGKLSGPYMRWYQDFISAHHGYNLHELVEVTCPKDRKQRKPTSLSIVQGLPDFNGLDGIICCPTPQDPNRFSQVPVGERRTSKDDVVKGSGTTLPDSRGPSRKNKLHAHTSLDAVKERTTATVHCVSQGDGSRNKATSHAILTTDTHPGPLNHFASASKELGPDASEKPRSESRDGIPSAMFLEAATVDPSFKSQVPAGERRTLKDDVVKGSGTTLHDSRGPSRKKSKLQTHTSLNVVKEAMTAMVHCVSQVVVPGILASASENLTPNIKISATPDIPENNPIDLAPFCVIPDASACESRGENPPILSEVAAFEQSPKSPELLVSDVRAILDDIMRMSADARIALPSLYMEVLNSFSPDGFSSELHKLAVSCAIPCRDHLSFLANSDLVREHNTLMFHSLKCATAESELLQVMQKKRDIDMKISRVNLHNTECIEMDLESLQKQSNEISQQFKDASSRLCNSWEEYMLVNDSVLRMGTEVEFHRKRAHEYFVELNNSLLHLSQQSVPSTS